MGNEDIIESLDFIRKQFKQCSPALLALGDTVRQDILMILTECLDGGMNVTDITARTNLSRPASPIARTWGHCIAASNISHCRSRFSRVRYHG